MIKHGIWGLIAILGAMAPLQATEPRWQAEGQVTDRQGRGMPGVTVRASCGWGTLMPTGSAVTDSSGRYRLLFGPGFHSSGGEVTDTGVQAAVITAWKDGYYEQNLSRHGDLLMGGSKPGPDNTYDPGRIVLPDAPRTLDFTLLPAAQISGRLVSPEGAPIPPMRIYVDGDELGPAASVLMEFTPDDEGHFTLSVPCKSYWFVPAAREHDRARSEPVTFDQPGPYKIRLVFDEHASSLRVETQARPGGASTR